LKFINRDINVKFGNIWSTGHDLQPLSFRHVESNEEQGIFRQNRWATFFNLAYQVVGYLIQRQLLSLGPYVGVTVYGYANLIPSLQNNADGSKKRYIC
jgi:hypothetical protein